MTHHLRATSFALAENVFIRSPSERAGKLVAWLLSVKSSDAERALVDVSLSEARAQALRHETCSLASRLLELLACRAFSSSSLFLVSSSASGAKIFPTGNQPRAT